MQERDFQAAIKKMLKGCNSMVLNLHGHGMQAPGWPDLYFSHRDLEGWIELKVCKNTVSEVQARIIEELRYRETYVAVITLRADGFVYNDVNEIRKKFTTLSPTSIIGFLEKVGVSSNAHIHAH